MHVFFRFLTILMLLMIFTSCASEKVLNNSTVVDVQEVDGNSTQNTEIVPKKRQRTVQEENTSKDLVDETISDGELYIKAIEKKDPSLCKSLHDEALKKMCTTEATKK